MDNKKPNRRQFHRRRPRSSPNPSNSKTSNLKASEEVQKLMYKLVNESQLTTLSKNDKQLIYKVVIDPNNRYKLTIPTSKRSALTLAPLIVNTETLKGSENVIRNFNSKARIIISKKKSTAEHGQDEQKTEKVKNETVLKYSPLFLINYLINNIEMLSLNQQDYKHYEINKLL